MKQFRLIEFPFAQSQFDIPELKLQTEEFISNNMKMESVVKILEMADHYNAAKLKLNAMQFIHK